MTVAPALNVWEHAARAFELRAPDPIGEQADTDASRTPGTLARRLTLNSMTIRWGPEDVALRRPRDPTSCDVPCDVPCDEPTGNPTYPDACRGAFLLADVPLTCGIVDSTRQRGPQCPPRVVHVPQDGRRAVGATIRALTCGSSSIGGAHDVLRNAPCDDPCDEPP